LPTTGRFKIKMPKKISKSKFQGKQYSLKWNPPFGTFDFLKKQKLLGVIPFECTKK
jgi:hypothetical protein